MSIASLDDAEGWPGAGASMSSFGGRDAVSAPPGAVVEETAGASYARRVRKSVIDALDVVQGFEVDAALDDQAVPDEHGERGALLQMLERREAGDVSTGVEFERLAPHLADLPAGEQTRMLTHLCQTLPPSLADQTHVESFCRDAFAGDPMSVLTRGVELLGGHACTFYNQLHAMVSSLPPEHSLTLLRSFFREIMHTVKGLLFVSTTCGERLDALRWRFEDVEAECARGRKKAAALEAELASCRADCARLAADTGHDEQGGGSGGGKPASAATAAPELRCVVMAQVQEARFLRRVCAGPYAEALALAERALDVLALKNGGVRVNHDPASAASTDQYCFAFPRPEHALWFAAEAQQRLLLLDYPPELLLYSCCAAEEASEAYRRDVVWRGPRLRFAAHYGRFLPEVRGGGGGGSGGSGGSGVLWYSGAAMRRCARLLEGARGGDVLASTRAKRAYDEAACAAAAAHAEEASAAPGAWDAEARRRHAGLVLACVPDPPKPHKKGDVWRVYDKLLEGRYCDGDKGGAEEDEEEEGVAASTMSSMALSSTAATTLADTFSSRGGDLSQLFDRVRIGATCEDGEEDDDEDSPGAGDGAGSAASPGVGGESEQLLAAVVKLQAATELGDQLVQHVASLTASQAALRSSLEASERHAMAAHDVAGGAGGGGVAVSATASRGSLGPRGSSPSSLARGEGAGGSSRRLPYGGGGGGSELKKTPSQRRSSTTTAGAVAAAAAAAAAASRQPLYPYPSGGQRAAAGAVLKYLRGGELSEEEERALEVVGTMPDVPKTTSFVARKVQRRWGTGFDAGGAGQGGGGADTSLCKVHAAVCELFRLLSGFVSAADGGRSPDAMLTMLLRTISGNRIERKAAPKAYTKLAVDHAELMGGAAPAASAVVSSVMGFVVKIFVLVRDSKKRRGSSPGSGGDTDFVDAFPIPAKGHGLPALQSRKRNTLTVFSVPGIDNRQKLLREKWGARRAGSIVLASDLPAASTASRRRSSDASEPRGCGSRSGARASVQSAQGHVGAPRVGEGEEGDGGGEGRGSGGGGGSASALTPPSRERSVVGTPTSPSPRGRLAPIQKE